MQRAVQRFSPMRRLGLVGLALAVTACHHSSSAPENETVTLSPGPSLLTGVNGQAVPAMVRRCGVCSDSLRILPDTFYLGATAGFEWHISFEGDAGFYPNPTVYQGLMGGNGGLAQLIGDGSVPGGMSGGPIGYIVAAATDSFVVTTIGGIVLGDQRDWGFSRR